MYFKEGCIPEEKMRDGMLPSLRTRGLATDTTTCYGTWVYCVIQLGFGFPIILGEDNKIGSLRVS